MYALVMVLGEGILLNIVFHLLPEEIHVFLPQEICRHITPS